MHTTKTSRRLFRAAIAYDIGAAEARMPAVTSWWLNVPRAQWIAAYEGERKRISASREYLKVSLNILR